MIKKNLYYGCFPLIWFLCAIYLLNYREKQVRKNVNEKMGAKCYFYNTWVHIRVVKNWWKRGKCENKNFILDVPVLYVRMFYTYLRKDWTLWVYSVSEYISRGLTGSESWWYTWAWCWCDVENTYIWYS